MSVESDEPERVAAFRVWFCNHGGQIHENLVFSADPSGLSVRTRRALQSEVTVASCPFQLAITLETTQEPLELFCRLTAEEQLNLSQRQRICAYICLHWIIAEAEDEKCILRHRPYIDILPKADSLLTPLYFSSAELDIFKGSNLYGAALDQRRTWSNEHLLLRDAIGKRSPNVSEKFTLSMYQAAATYLSSRAFPSTLLSHTPSLVVSPSSYPVLLPGVDSFNHKRGQPVIWGISRIRACTSSTSFTAPSAVDPNLSESDLCVALTITTPTAEGEEVFNNYGPKPNSSLILGYGFALPDNPDDTIVLKVGSAAADGAGSGERVGHEVGRDAGGADALWNDVLRIVASGYGEQSQCSGVEEENAAGELQIDMETVETLSDMVSSLIARLPDLTVEHISPSIRSEVLSMWRYYVRGQKDILEALLDWLEGKVQDVVRRAEELGINIVGDDLEDDLEDE